jgi:RNA polymerase sigma factor (sigma-70 family)
LLVEKPERLIEDCLTGHPQAQSTLYALYAPKMMVVCMRYTKNVEEAEEILHDGFVRVFTYLHTLKEDNALEGWIRKIMVNCALQKIKSENKIETTIQIEHVETELEDDTDIVSNISGKEMLLLIQKLTPAYSLVFNLYYFEGYKHKEIAELLNINEGTSKSNLFQAKRLLKEMIVGKSNLV